MALAATKAALLRSLFTVGALCRHFDFDLEQFKGTTKVSQPFLICNYMIINKPARNKHAAMIVMYLLLIDLSLLALRNTNFTETRLELFNICIALINLAS